MISKGLQKEAFTTLKEQSFLSRFAHSFPNSTLSPKKDKPFFSYLNSYLQESTSIAPLAVYRILFGFVMLTSIIRFLAKGWVNDFYIQPKLYFPFYGFEWIAPLGGVGMYIVFALLIVSSAFIMLGLFYRLSAISFFLLFTYVELIDKTNYLNHYYFISIVSFLMIFVPANRYFSIDSALWPKIKAISTPKWCIDILKLQIGIVYFYAGIAKLNYDWLFRAMPLSIWLPAHNDFPIIGFLFEYTWIAFFFSWFGALYDLCIPFLLLYKRTRWIGFVLVLAFHLLTVSLFQIGMFPYIMILSSFIFFSADVHQQILTIIKKFIPFTFVSVPSNRKVESPPYNNLFIQKVVLSIVAFHFFIQILLPWRFLLYPGKLFWTEQGYRFSWRVMLIEKAGVAYFYVKDKTTGNEWEVTNSDFLTLNQEKMMATQPDMILQFAHFLKDFYKKQGITDPEIRVKSYVTLNGSSGKPLVDDKVNLIIEKDSFKHKNWVTSFDQEPK